MAEYPEHATSQGAQDVTLSSTSSNIRRPRKRLRTSRACDFCHKRSIRCQKVPAAVRCQNCTDFDIICTYDRPAKKRGVPSRQNGSGPRDLSSGNEEHHQVSSAQEVASPKQYQTVEARVHAVAVDDFSSRDVTEVLFPLAPEHHTLIIKNQDMITELLNVYFEVVYPIFPLFHRNTLLRKVEERVYLSDQKVYSVVMALCALALARARDGAVFPGRWHASYFQQADPDSYFSAAKDSIPRDLSAMKGLDGMRTCALLALYGIQISKIDMMHQYLGMYHSLVAMDGLHNESNWPKGIGLVEIEERRRLFWSMYTLDVYSSIVWGGIVRCREAQSQVSYPNEVDDDHFSNDGYTEPVHGSPMTSHSNSMSLKIVSSTSWLHSWNFTTDLYRILEHSMDDLHRRQPQLVGPFSPSEMFIRDTPSQSIILEKIMSMYNELHPKLKETNNFTRRSEDDIFSFQAANIVATLQLVRMVLFTAAEATVEQKCTIARELLEGFSQVPVLFLRAISSPLLYHLAGIGSILGSAIEGPLSESCYYQVRDVLLGMADLLESLEMGILRTVGTAKRLRSQVTRIDEYMVAQRQLEQTQATLRYGQGNAAQSDNALQSSPLVRRADPSTTQWPSDSMGYQYIDSNKNPGDATDESLFQLPPELLEGWPWNSELPQNFSLFDLGHFQG